MDDKFIQDALELISPSFWPADKGYRQVARGHLGLAILAYNIDEMATADKNFRRALILDIDLLMQVREWRGDQKWRDGNPNPPMGWRTGNEIQGEK